jgi:hypothetical protein
MTTRTALILSLLAWPMIGSAEEAKPGEAKPAEKKPAAKKPAAKRPPKPEAVTDPAKAGPDYWLQGEFVGDAPGGGKLAAQVFALGEGRFDVWFLAGGLPGDGWDGKGRVKASAATADGKTAVSGGGYEATLEGTPESGRIAGKTPDGKDFALTRVLRRSPTEGAKPPAGAVVLFDGNGTDHWKGGKVTPDGLLLAGPTTLKPFGDCTLHVEFRTCWLPTVRGQDRSNSGVYIQQRYEIQVLDSFAIDLRNNHCGSVYTQIAPAVNMCLPPLSWQTYDIEFRGPRFDADGKKIVNARITVLHNGVKVHDDVEVKSKTGYGKPEGPAPGPLTLQNHGSPVAYRNVWLVEKPAPEKQP